LLFHPFLNRKSNPALFIRGDPSPFKTFFGEIFQALSGPDSIDTISRNLSRFNLGKLKKEDNTPYILVLDDFRWKQLGMHLPDF
jgi:hypothetical protein